MSANWLYMKLFRVRCRLVPIELMYHSFSGCEGAHACGCRRMLQEVACASWGVRWPPHEPQQAIISPNPQDIEVSDTDMLLPGQAVVISSTSMGIGPGLGPIHPPYGCWNDSMFPLL